LCRPHLKCIRKLIKIQAIQNKEEAINKRLISRAEDTISNQSRMLSSLLNKDHKKINIDRLVTIDENNVPTLHTNPDDILTLAPKQYSALLRPRKHQFDELPDDWKEIYDPLQHFPDNVYEDLLTEPSYKEWHEATNKCSLNTAPGISGITYLLIKKLHPNVQETLRKFAGIIYRTAFIPVEWKTSQIFPIPKPYDWHFCLERTRPIILLECLRKLIIRVINTRLANLCIKHNILRGPNFGGLPGGTTKTPIHILHNAIEDAKSNNNELWVAFQDMSKAFDSIGMTPLRFALRRIKLPDTAINFIINLFQYRKMKIITNFGLSEELSAADGID